MYLQVLEGKVRDTDLLDKQMGVWRSDVRPGAIGFLGSTGGLTAEGRWIVAARFASESEAQQNSDRPEQDAWWRATAPAFEGDLTVTNCDEVDVFLGGGSDAAGFVQVMKGRATDPAKLRAMGNDMEDVMTTVRPDVLGGYVGWHGDRGFVQVMYFTSEDEARQAEASQDAESDGPDEWSALIDGEIEFIDLPDPMFD